MILAAFIAPPRSVDAPDNKKCVMRAKDYGGQTVTQPVHSRDGTRKFS